MPQVQFLGERAAYAETYMGRLGLGVKGGHRKSSGAPSQEFSSIHPEFGHEMEAQRFCDAIVSPKHAAKQSLARGRVAHSSPIFLGLSGQFGTGGHSNPILV